MSITEHLWELLEDLSLFLSLSLPLISSHLKSLRRQGRNDTTGTSTRVRLPEKEVKVGETEKLPTTTREHLDPAKPKVSIS